MKPRILLVEDEAVIRDHLAHALADEFVVDTATDGEQALLLVLANRPNLIVTDITVVEGNSGTTDGVFTVRMVPASTQEATVEFTTLDDTAKAPGDYESARGTLKFEPGATLLRRKR